MNRALAIVLTVLFLLNLIGVVGYFGIRQYQIRTEIRHQILRGLPDSALTVITIRPSDIVDLAWQGADEFHFRGVMYDVVRKEVSGDSATRYYCFPDEDETELFARMEPFIGKCAGKDGLACQTYKSWFETFSDVELPSQTVLYSLTSPDSSLNPMPFDPYESPAIRVVFPPPKAFKAFS